VTKVKQMELKWVYFHRICQKRRIKRFLFKFVCFLYTLHIAKKKHTGNLAGLLTL